MNKAYNRINWENYPSDKTPLNENNLNKIDSALDEVDNRVIEHETTKATKTEVAALVADVTFEETTGIITVTKKNGSVIKIDTKMEKIAVNFDFNAETQQIILTLIDGTKQYIDLSELITQYEFLNSDTITFIVQTDGTVKAEVLDGSITENKLNPNYLAKIKVEVAKAQASEINASTYATKSQSYAVGGTGTRENEDIDNAMYYYKQSKEISEGLKGGLLPHGTVLFSELPNIANVGDGWMYNVSDEFTTTSDFKEGSGLTIPAGSNVYKTVDGYWDVLAGSPVTGVKGANETTFQRGNVNITADGVGAVAIGGDTADNVISFVSSDETEPTEYTDVELLVTGESHNSLLSKISTMFKNIRYLYKMLGTTDISSIGDGTVTGGLNSLNSNFINLGTIVSSDSGTWASTATNGVWTDGVSAKFTKGLYLVIFQAYSTTCACRIGQYTSTGYWSTSTAAHDTAQFVAIMSFSNDSTWTSKVFTSSSATVYSRIRAIKIK